LSGKPKSEEHKKKLSDAGKGNIPWNKGKKGHQVGSRLGSKHTEEAKEKMSLSHRGKIMSEEQKQKISETLKGRKISEETRKKMSEAAKVRKINGMQGKRHTEETKKKISLNKTKFASKNPLQALEFIENYSVDNPTTFILKDFNKFLSDMLISRKIKNLSRQLKSQQKFLIIIGTENTIPKELLSYFKFLYFSFSNEKEIKNELVRLGNSIGKNFDNFFLDNLVK
jgi:hypothetical protein